MAASHDQAYIAGLTLLARRELSEAQLRQRLLRRGLEADAVEAALLRLKAERALDDGRVAEAIARTELTLRHRGRARVERRVQAAGIAAATARDAVDRVFAEIDPDALLESALRKRLKPEDHIADRKTFERLYRFLAAQGFDGDRIVAQLRRRMRTPAVSEHD